MMDIISANYNEISDTQLQLENKQQELLKNYEDIENIIAAIDKAKVRLKANVNFDVTIELMILTMKD